MKKIMITIMLATTMSMLMVGQAEARRFGGGFRSFGRTSTFRAPRTPMKSSSVPKSAGTKAGARTPRNRSRWGGMLGGALLGLGLGSLLGSMGIGGAAANMISTLLMFGLIGFAIMFILRRLGRKQQQQYQQQYGYDPYQRQHTDTPEIGSHIDENTYYQGQTAALPHQPIGVPEDFDVPAFLRAAKTYFIRLQAAWDKADVQDIREYTTPEMFGELKMQLHERGGAQNHTDVVSLEAELIGIENINNEQMASVLFSGSIKEELNGTAVPFSEMWNLTRPLSGSGGWVVAGIQQT